MFRFLKNKLVLCLKTIKEHVIDFLIIFLTFLSPSVDFNPAPGKRVPSLFAKNTLSAVFTSLGLDWENMEY